MTGATLDDRTSRRGFMVDLGPALGLLLFHLTFLPGYGVFRDELYYLACGRHPGWGYVDHPPLVGWVAWLVRQVAGDSHLALRVVAAVAAADSWPSTSLESAAVLFSASSASLSSSEEHCHRHRRASSDNLSLLMSLPPYAVHSRVVGSRTR